MKLTLSLNEYFKFSVNASNLMWFNKATINVFYFFRSTFLSDLDQTNEQIFPKYTALQVLLHEQVTTG